MKNKIRAALVSAICAGALVAVPASSVAATPHGSPYGTCYSGPYSTCKHMKPKLYDAHASDWWKGKFTFGFALARASDKAYPLKSFKVTLPKGITWNKRTYKRDIHVSDRYSAMLKSKDTLLVTLKSSDDKVMFSAKSDATKVDRSAMKAREIKVRVSATDSGHKTYGLGFSMKKPKPKPKHHHKKHHH